MNNLYKRNELGLAIMWIIVYVVSLSIADSISVSIGVYKSVTMVVSIFLSMVLYRWVKKYGYERKYGLCYACLSPQQVWFYIPLILIASINLWHGIYVNYSLVEIIFHVIAMLGVGFLEEIIFRGLLFKAMCKDGLISAIIVSSMTFGIGHIINLFNGSGVDLLSNLLQVAYAIGAGFMFTLLFLKSGSLWACIITHGVMNALSVFQNPSLSEQQNIYIAILLCVVSGVYAIRLARLENKGIF